MLQLLADVLHVPVVDRPVVPMLPTRIQSDLLAVQPEPDIVRLIHVRLGSELRPIYFLRACEILDRIDDRVECSSHGVLPFVCCCIGRRVGGSEGRRVGGSEGRRVGGPVRLYRLLMSSFITAFTSTIGVPSRAS